MNNYNELLEIKTRYEVFLDKLLQKAVTLEKDAKGIAQEVYDEDPDRHKRSYLQFKAGINGQFNSIKDKAIDVFNRQVFSRRTNVSVHSNEYSKFISLFNEIEKNKTDFTDLMYNKSEAIFESVTEISASQKLDEILTEFNKVKNDFNCSQCGGHISIEELYFVSTYLTCPYCQTQNTFIPSSRMKEVHFLAKEVGEEKHNDLLLACEQEKEMSVKKLYLFYQYRAFVWLESIKIVPSLENENAEVFYREIHDFLAYQHTKVFMHKQDNYAAFLKKLDLENTYIPITPRDKLELLNLSLIFLKRFGDFGLFMNQYDSTIKYLSKLQSTQAKNII